MCYRWISRSIGNLCELGRFGIEEGGQVYRHVLIHEGSRLERVRGILT